MNLKILVKFHCCINSEKMTNRALIYARVSSSNERQSTARQVSDLRRFAASAGYEVVGVFEEKASGAKDDRPVLADCIAALRAGAAETLLVTEISRLGRSVRMIINTIDQLTKEKIDVYLLDLGIHTLDERKEENPLAKMVVTILGLGAELERKTIVNRLNSGREAAKAKGVQMGRPKGSAVTRKEFLKKHKDVVKLLDKGYNLANTAKLCECGISTVQRVKKALSEEK